ncbi:hypothetical protein QUF54_10480 [Candidatus Marithioploca araucensis]|uniref:Lipoprotein n=1 Tax=Candidatus Marithioploca araucensis TaxID=70273 RepID=A0ABT7VW12_9GAMM|nr:hypothetical protein [Candidatus Marithioploca araucensis]
MQWPFFVPIKLWHLLSLVVIILLNGCFSTKPPIVDTTKYHTVKRSETPKIVQTDNEPVNPITNANERVVGDLVGEAHKVLRKKNTR